MRARTLWLFSLPILLLSEAAGHALVARMLETGAERHRPLLRAVLDYLEYGQAAVAALFALGGLVLVRRALESFRRAGPRPLPGWRLAALPPLVFLVQEHLERFAQNGDSAWLTAAEPAVLAGVALQVPCGLLALWLARTLLRAADGLGYALARRTAAHARRAPASPGALSTAVPPLRLPVLASQHAGRAPPTFA
jgi:hypothetical protein